MRALCMYYMYLLLVNYHLQSTHLGSPNRPTLRRSWLALHWMGGSSMEDGELEASSEEEKLMTIITSLCNYATAMLPSISAPLYIHVNVPNS